MTTITTPRFDVPVGFVEVGGVRLPCLLSREFVRFFEGLLERGGGPTGTSTAELELEAFEDAGIEDIRIGMFSLADAQEQSQMVQLRETVDALRRRIEALEQGTLQ